MMIVFDVRLVRIEVKVTCLCGKLNKNSRLTQDAYVTSCLSRSTPKVSFLETHFSLSLASCFSQHKPSLALFP